MKRSGQPAIERICLLQFGMLVCALYLLFRCAKVQILSTVIHAAKSVIKYLGVYATCRNVYLPSQNACGYS